MKNLLFILILLYNFAYANNPVASDYGLPDYKTFYVYQDGYYWKFNNPFIMDTADCYSDDLNGTTSAQLLVVMLHYTWVVIIILKC